MTDERRVIVVGGGIAGLAAALRLGEHGIPVTLLEKREVLGGRASSFKLNPSSRNSPEAAEEEEASAVPSAIEDEWVDNCQHVLMRCCVNLLDFYRRIGAEQDVAFYDRFLFVDRSGRRSTLSASQWLPAPLHLFPSLLRFQSMRLPDKIAIGYAMARLAVMKSPELTNHGLSFGEWLARNRQTPGAIECFWRPVVVSALNEEPERTAAPYAFDLFRKAFLANRRAFEMGLPAGELASIYSSAAGAALRKRGVDIRVGCRVSRLLTESGSVTGIVVDGQTAPADTVVSAVPFHALVPLLEERVAEQPSFRAWRELSSSPITGIHLWFDRPVADQPHLALLGREMQWIFSKDWQTAADATPGTNLNERDVPPDCSRGRYLGLVVSASRDLTGCSQAHILALARDAVNAVFPKAREARVLREVVIREPRATFSPAPGAEAIRPAARTPVSGLYLAGDWIRTGWPATMEGAVRGGYLAAQAVLQDRGLKAHLLSPEMPSDPIPRILGL